MPDSEFVTVAEAARALQLSERQVRRYLPLLRPTDKRQDANRQHKGQPVGLVSLEALRKASTKDSNTEKPSGTANGHATGVPVETSGKASGVPVELLAALAEANQRAAVAEARAELLATSLADVQRERNDWKEQAAGALEALQRAQDEARAARLMPTRAAMQIEASGLTGGDSGVSEVSGGGITTLETVETIKQGFWGRLFRRGN